MQGDDIKYLQTYLNSKGYDCGIPDGVFGTKSKQAVMLFQQANGLNPDGSFGPNTRVLLLNVQIPTQNTTINRTLKLTIPRMQGDDIKYLQTYLNSKGYDCGIPDGVFGTKSKQAVMLFQQANGLNPDGSVGSITRGMIK